MELRETRVALSRPAWLPYASDTGTEGEYADPKSEEPESRPTINLFKLWEDGSQQARVVSARDYHCPMRFVVSCPWLACPRALSLKDALDGGAHNSSDRNRLEGDAHNSLIPGTHFPNQPNLSKGSTESNSLTFWWGATLSRPELNDVALAEDVVIAMTIAAMTELTMNTEVAKPIARSILEFDGGRMTPAVESNPHSNLMIYNSTFDGAELITKFADADSEDTEARRSLAKVQTGTEIPLRSTSDFHLPTNPWPKPVETVTKKNAFAFTKRKTYWKRPEQGNNWDQYGDSFSAA